MCISKRTAGVLNREWDVVPMDDSQEAREQASRAKKMLEESDSRNEDGLTEALKHLTMASFRGRSAIKPFFVDGKLLLKKL